MTDIGCLKVSLITVSFLMLWIQLYTVFLFVSNSRLKSETGYRLEINARIQSQNLRGNVLTLNNGTHTDFTPSIEQAESDRILLQKLKYMYEDTLHKRRKRLEREEINRKTRHKFIHHTSKLRNMNDTGKHREKEIKSKTMMTDKILDLSTYPLNVDLKYLLKNMTMRTDDSQQINRYLGTYIHAPWKRCLDLKQNPFLVFIIRSYSANFARRKMIRNTWANESVTKDLLFKRIFFLGDPKNENVQKDIDSEQKAHRDILELNLDENRSTVKMLRALHWSVSYCSKSRYYMIVDDNMFVATDNLLQVLDSLSKTRTINYMGSVLPAMSPIRDQNNMWYISMEDYPYSKYPDFVYGGAVIFSSNFSNDVLFAAKYTKFLDFEDVYVGIIAHKLGIKPQVIENFETHIRIDFHDPKFKHVLVSSGYGNEHRLKSAWIAHRNIHGKYEV